MKVDNETKKDIAIVYWKNRAMEQDILCQKWKQEAIKFKCLHRDLLKKKNAKRSKAEETIGKQREMKMSKQMEVKRWMIITKDEEDTISEQEINIEVIPVWKWLC